MELDDPTKPEFASWRSYHEFERGVRRRRRYVWDKKTQAFLDTVRATLKARAVKISDRTILYRAQRGIDYDPVQDDSGEEIAEEPHGFGRMRMKPLSNRAKEGRINAAGIPVLYLASSEVVAISEVRPWVGSEVSVAQFEVLRDLKAANLSLGHGQTAIDHLKFAHLLGEEEASAEEKEKAVWIDIDNAFSRPVTLSDDAADYVPTQILAELFREIGYDAIIYRSSFGEKGYNIALFSIADAEPINCLPIRLEQVGLR